MYVDGSRGYAGQVARFISRPVSNTVSHHTYCLYFMYHMFGSGMGRLEVKIKDADGAEQILWDKSGNQGVQWHKAHVSVSVVDAFQVCIPNMVFLYINLYATYCVQKCFSAICYNKVLLLLFTSNWMCPLNIFT